ncbi:MAG: hypothetical protein Q7V01_16200 [Vicinamibacterales bacterium]|nr:hypothetical protein [Vicinamibacterales bacterium]
MHIRRWVLASFAVALCAASVAPMDPVFAQQPDKKVVKAQQEELQAVLKIADAVTAGQPAPADFTMTFSNDFLKAQDGKMYIPFTLAIPADSAPPANLTMYLRVVARNPPVAAAPPADAKDKKAKDDKNNRPEYAFEDAFSVDLRTPDPGQPFRFSRAFTVPAGEFDVLLVLKERAPIEKKVKNAVYKTAVLKQPLTIPDFWNGTLATSSVILAADVSPVSAPMTPQELREQPYTLGTTKITPTPSNKLLKKGELSVVFIIYNSKSDETSKKPDVTVEYGFYQKVATEPNGEKFFNKTNPQNFNATTLPPQFDPAVGHQLVAGQSVPLGSFPEGDYRLEIKVTDKLAGSTVTHNLPFSVGS